MIKRLAHVCIYTNDLAETEKFYCEGLELELGFKFYKDDKLFGYYIKLGNDSFIEVFQGDPGGDGNIKHLAIEVDDLDAVIARLKEHGYEIGEKMLGNDAAWQTWTTDPNGVAIEFHQYTEESMQLVGGRCIVDW